MKKWSVMIVISELFFKVKQKLQLISIMYKKLENIIITSKTKN